MPKRRARHIHANASAPTINADSVAAARAAYFGGFGALDAKRPTAWAQYGYKDNPTIEDFRQAYERGGAGHGAVHRVLDACWASPPRIKDPKSDKPAKWEESVSKLLTSINAWQKLRDFDRRNLIGRYSALIYRVADGKPLSEPLARAKKLVDLVPVFEDQIQVTAWDSDPASENFGKPRMWQYRMRKPGEVDTQGAPDHWVDVHPSRVQVLAEGSVGDFFDGVPLLRAGFNHLVDLEKISGGSAESYLKNSSRHLVLEFDPQSSPQAIQRNPDGSQSTKSVREIVEDQARSLNRSIDASIVTQGGKVTTLQTSQVDPEPAFMVSANLFAASVRVPFTILFGQQTGRLASDQDSKDMDKRAGSRQQTELTPMITELIKRLQACGAVPEAEFVVEWPPLGAPSEGQMADVLGKMTGAMKQAADSGISEPLFDANELRKVMRFEPRADDGMPEPGELDDAEDDQPGGLRAVA